MAGWRKSRVASIMFGILASACADGSAVAIIRGEVVGGAAGADSGAAGVDSGAAGADSRAPLQFLAETGTVTGGFINKAQDGGGYKVVLDSAGDTICFGGVDMQGFSSATLRYGNGESGGDTVQLTYPTIGTVIATFMLAHTGGWATADMQDLTVSFAAQTGTGEICLIGQGSGWIASVDSISLQ
jgi:hypothetical protein